MAYRVRKRDDLCMSLGLKQESVKGQNFKILNYINDIKYNKIKSGKENIMNQTPVNHRIQNSVP